MHIGLIIYGSLDTVSGGYLYDRKLVDYLRRAGERVDIISLTRHSYGRNLLDNLSSDLFGHLARSRFDVLLQDELNHPSLFALNDRLRRSVDYPVVSIVHHLRVSEQRPAWQNALYRLVERRYLQSVDGFIFNSRTTQHVVETLTGMERPAVVARPGGDRLGGGLAEEEIVARAREPGPLRVLFVGNAIPRKGLHTLLEALTQLPQSDWRLTAAGSLSADPDYTAAIQEMIRRGRLSEHVHLAGTVPDTVLGSLMAQSDVLVVPSSYEGFGIVYLEGMAFGLPAVATTAGAAHEIIAHERSGFLIAPGDTAALSRHLQSLVSDRERLAAMSLAARRRFSRSPTWDATTSAIHRFLQELAAPHSQP